MSAFRFAPPSWPEHGITRHRLLRLLESRFSVRLVIVTAPAGYGKTTALSEAIEFNRLAPRGVDLYLGCNPADSDAGHLTAGLGAALGNVECRTIDNVLDQLARRAPVPTVVMFDDVHEVVAGSPGAALLDSLVAVLPPHVHALLSGRTTPPVDVARYQHREVQWIERHALLLDEQEKEALSSTRNVPRADVDRSGGWVGAAVLGTRGRLVLGETILHDLEARARRLLRVLVTIGGGDDEMVAAAIGTPVDLRAELADVPLLAVNERGWLVPHALWTEAAALSSTDLDVSAARLAAAKVCCARGDTLTALAILNRGPLDDATWPLFSEIVARECLVMSSFVAGARLAVAATAVPSERETSALGHLLSATLARIRGDRADAIVALDRTIDVAREQGEPLVELAAIAQRAHAAWWQDDIRIFAALFSRVLELQAGGLAEVSDHVAMGRAMLAEIAGELPAMLEHCESVSQTARNGTLGAAIDFLHARALLNLGRAGESVAYARRAMLSPQAFPSTRLQHARSRWFAGNVDEVRAELEALAPEPSAPARDHFLANLHLAVASASLGLLERAHHHLAAALAHKEALEGARALLLLDSVRAYVAVAAGDEVTAGDRLRSALGDEPAPGVLGALRTMLPVVYVLVPGSRALYDAMDLGPCWHELRRASRLLTRLRDDTATAPQLTTDLSAALVVAGLPLPWSIELAVRLGHAPLADRIVEVVGTPAAAALRQLAGATSALGEKARTLLKSVGLPPQQTVSLRVLGPMSLMRDGTAVDDADWRRGRVRALVALLLVRERVTREQACAALWPDLDTEAAAANLRTTLRYLHRALEPDRAPGAASWFVRSDGDALSLHREGLDVDSWEMERAFAHAHAADGQGQLARALAEFDAGFRLWRGDLLAEIYDDWVAAERDRVRAVALAAVTRAGELLLGRGALDAALTYGTRAIEAEPWSEAGHRLVMAAHLGRRDRASARRALERCHAALRELGSEPEPETIMLERAVLGLNV